MPHVVVALKTSVNVLNQVARQSRTRVETVGKGVAGGGIQKSCQYCHWHGPHGCRYYAYLSLVIIIFLIIIFLSPHVQSVSDRSKRVSGDELSSLSGSHSNLSEYPLGLPALADVAVAVLNLESTGFEASIQ